MSTTGLKKGEWQPICNDTLEQSLSRVVVIGRDELPIAFAKGGEVGTAMAVRKVHEEFAVCCGACRFAKERSQFDAVDHVISVVATGDVEDGREDVVNGSDVSGIDDTGRNGAFLLKSIVRVLFGPGGDEGNAHATFVVGAFLAAQRSGAGDLVGSTHRSVSAVVAEEDHEGIFCNAELVELIEHVAEGFIHAFDVYGGRIPQSNDPKKVIASSKRVGNCESWRLTGSNG